MHARFAYFLVLDMRCQLCRFLAGRKFDSKQLQSIAIELPTFFRKSNNFCNWLPGLANLQHLELTVHLDSLEKLLEAVPAGLRELSIRILFAGHGCDRDAFPHLQKFSTVTQLKASSSAMEYHFLHINLKSVTKPCVSCILARVCLQAAPIFCADAW